MCAHLSTQRINEPKESSVAVAVVIQNILYKILSSLLFEEALSDLSNQKINCLNLYKKYINGKSQL